MRSEKQVVQSKVRPAESVTLASWMRFRLRALEDQELSKAGLCHARMARVVRSLWSSQSQPRHLVKAGHTLTKRRRKKS